MILLILSISIIIALVVVFSIKIQQKVLILSLCVILLVIFNFANEIQTLYENNNHSSLNYSGKDKSVPFYQLNKTALIKLDNNSS